METEPDEVYHFVDWTGGVDDGEDINAASMAITTNDNYSITTTFAFGIGCFIATPDYGTPMAGEIEILREFRDEYLLTNPLGQGFVDIYYTISPPIADFITGHPNLKPIIRAGLLPAVAMSAVVVNTTPAEKVAIIGLLVLLPVATAVLTARRRGRGPEYA